MIDSAIFIGAAIIAVTQAVKLVAPKVNGVITIIVAVVIGVLVGLLDKQIGVVDITVAQGIMIALAAVGVHTTVSSISTGSSVPKA